MEARFILYKGKNDGNRLPIANHRVSLDASAIEMSQGCNPAMTRRKVSWFSHNDLRTQQATLAKGSAVERPVGNATRERKAHKAEHRRIRSG